MRINLLIILSLFLTGCVTGTRTIELTTPDIPDTGKAKGTVYISGINDNRVFEQKPASPSTPSVKGQLSSVTKDQLSTMIGRQRNGYGMAMGDVALSDGNVQQTMQALLEEGLQSRGYTLSTDENTALKLSVDIEKFWAWFSPGMFTVSFEANLESKLKFSGDRDQQVTVTGYGLNKGQVASDANWMLAYSRAFDDFLSKLDQALEDVGL